MIKRRNSSTRPISIIAMLMLMAAPFFGGIALASTVPVTNQGQMDSVGSNGNALTLSNTVTLELQQAGLDLSKSVDRSEATPGEPLHYRLTLNNSGDNAESGIAVTVDGIAREAVVLRDALPANTRYIQGSGNGEIVFHRAGEPIHSYTSTPPETANLDAIAALFATVAPGSEINVEFDVATSEQSSGPVKNQATVFSANSTTQSNQTVTSMPVQPGRVRFYNDAENNNGASRKRSGEQVFVGAEAAGCNTDSTVRERYTFRLTTTISGDAETFEAVETAANSGHFSVEQAVPLRSAADNPVETENGSIEASENDRLWGELLGCDAPVESAMLLVDPRGVVFDSRSNQPIAAAVVTLIDVTGEGNGGNAGGPARVFEEDGTTPAPSTVTTGADGAYQFPLVAESSYALRVMPPGSYLFPSQVAPGDLPSGRVIEAEASYGGTFRINGNATEDRVIDIPLDLAPGSLFVTTVLDSTEVIPGDFVNARIDVSNVSGMDLTDVLLELGLPQGFALVPGSIRLNGEPVDIIDGRLALGDLAIDGNAQITLLLVANGNASNGDVVSSARGNASNNNIVISNTVRNSLRVRRVLGESYVIGSVYLDCNPDHLRGGDEPGVPGVRIYMEDGSYVVTDAEGHYSFYGLRTLTHVLKLDRSTLPANALARATDFRHAGDGYSRFVDLKAGELHKANFPLQCTDAIRAETIARRKLRLEPGRENRAVIDATALDREFRVDDDVKSDRQRLAAQQSQTAAFTENRLPGYTSPKGQLTDPRSRYADVPATLDVKTWLPTQSNELAFVDLKDGDVLPFNRVTLRIKGRLGANLALTINGTAVDPKSIGQRASDKTSRVAYWEYVGVPLQAGVNTLTAQLVDGFGNVRTEQTILVRVPGELAQLQIELPETPPVAGGNAPIDVLVRLVDADGTPVRKRIPITLETTVGRWLTTDLSDVEPGLQVLIENGTARIQLLPPVDAARGLLRASTGRIETEREIRFLPDLRPLLVVGVIEGTIHVGKSSNDDRDARLFEQRLNELSDSHDGDRVDFGVRGAMFLKGRVRGDYLLTMRYDSERNNEDQLFRDIQPDRFYPIYGDAAQRGFDARSTSPLYVRVDKGNSYLLYGDLITDPQTDVVQLANLRRALTGVQHQFQNERFKVTSFASQDSTDQVVDEIPAEGVSGPYSLSRNAIRGNSEAVELITRDRDQPSVIISTQPQQRFTDYILDPIDGELVFRRAIPSVDPNLNPISIRVRYEVAGGGDRYWIGGIQGDVKITDKLTIGAGWIEDRNKVTPLRLQNIHASWKLAARTELQAEMARSDNGVESATGWRTELSHSGERLNVQAEIGEVDAGFDNPSSSIQAGRREARVRGDLRVSASDNLIADVLYSEDTGEDGTRRSGAELGWRHRLGARSEFELGGRHSRQRDNDGNRFNSSSVRGRIESAIPGVQREHRYFIEAEQDVKHSDRRQLAIGGNVQLHERSRLYARHELISSSAGAFGLDDSDSRNNTVVGIDSDYFDQGHAFSEYRSRNAIDGRSAEAAVGLRNRWQLNDELSVNGAFERITPLAGDARVRTAVGVGAEWIQSEQLKATGRLEWRESESGHSWFNTLGIAARVSRNWSMLGRNVLSIDDGSSRRLEDRLQFGLAYRDRDDDRIHGLTRYEFRLIDGDNSLNRAQLVTGHINYQPRSSLILSGSAGLRVVDYSLDDVNAHSNTQSLHGRINWRAAERWDLGLQTGLLGSNSLEQREYGVGVEVGYLLQANVWVAAGFNFSGYEDDDFGSDSSAEGAFVRLRMKFDENLFGAGQ